jgi:hypothetical protein
MKRIVLKIFLFFIAVSAINGQEVNVTAKFDSSSIYIGDQIKFSVTVDKPAALNINMQLLKDTLCKNIEILSGPVVDTVPSSDGRLKIISKYLITSFDSGFYQVRPQFAEVKNEEGIRRFYSDYSQLRVMRVKIAPADTAAKIFDIIKPYRAPVTIGEIIPWLLIILVAGALIWFIIRYIRNHKKIKSGIEPVINPDPAHVIAFRELENLQNKKLWQNGELKMYYSELTGILRQYLENRFSVYSLELTTAETLDALTKTGFKKDERYNQLKAVLTNADLVKFAKYLPDAVENVQHYENSWAFVEATKLTEVKDEETHVYNKGMEGSK